MVAGALTVSACGGGGEESSSTSAASPGNAGGTTEAVGASNGDIAQFAAPDEFWCLDGEPTQAQATLGWSVPEAKEVKVFLDGDRLHSGIRNQLPYSVLAGDAPGIGTTVVFPCEGNEHEIEVRWRLGGDAPPAERTVTITKASGA